MFQLWGESHFLNWIGAYLESNTTILLIIGGNDVLHYIHTSSNYITKESLFIIQAV